MPCRWSQSSGVTWRRLLPPNITLAEQLTDRRGIKILRTTSLQTLQEMEKMQKVKQITRGRPFWKRLIRGLRFLLHRVEPRFPYPFTYTVCMWPQISCAKLMQEIGSSLFMTWCVGAMQKYLAYGTLSAIYLSQIINKVLTLLRTGLFQDPTKNFLGPFRSPRMLKYF